MLLLALINKILSFISEEMYEQIFEMKKNSTIVCGLRSLALLSMDNTSKTLRIKKKRFFTKIAKNVFLFILLFF